MKKQPKSNTHGGARPGAGRPGIGNGPSVKILTIVTVEQREKLARLGGSAWIRDRIDRAKEPG